MYCPHSSLLEGWTIPITHVLEAVCTGRNPKHYGASPPFGCWSSVSVCRGGIVPEAVATFPGWERGTIALIGPNGQNSWNRWNCGPTIQFPSGQTMVMAAAEDVQYLNFWVDAKCMRISRWVASIRGWISVDSACVCHSQMCHLCLGAIYIGHQGNENSTVTCKTASLWNSKSSRHLGPLSAVGYYINIHENKLVSSNDQKLADKQKTWDQTYQHGNVGGLWVL